MSRQRIEVDRVVVGGAASGPIVRLDEPLSFWGGFDAGSGLVTDVHHPQHGESLSGAVVAISRGRGSSSASSVLAEAARLGTAPAALVMIEADEIISTGAIVADELYGRPLPVVEVAAEVHAQLRNGVMVRFDGSVLFVDELG